MDKFICEKCGKQFKQKSSLTKHINNIKICTKKISDTNTNTNIQPIEINILYNNKHFIRDIHSSFINPIKPILKWVGGKTQILDKLISSFPIEINNYHEIFLGGGSVLLLLLTYVKHDIIKINGNIYTYDLNEPLIYMYKNIQTNPNELYDEIQKLIKELNESNEGEKIKKPQNIQEAQLNKENYYYWIRDKYNKLNSEEKKSVIGSAMFIFLNKTCFRGLFRIGPNGFNVPYGNYKNPEIINKEHLLEIHMLIQNVIFTCCDFTHSLNNIKENDFIYLDPPYAPETESSFVDYTEKGFTLDNHKCLFKIIHELSEKNNIRIMLSNADVSLVRSNFNIEKKFNITSLLCKRAINSKNPEAKAKEVIITNY